MRTWSVGYNNYYRTGGVYLREAPWYIFFLKDGVWWICDKIPRIPLPPITVKISRNEAIKYNDGNENVRLDEYYYDLHHLFHDRVCMKVFNWCEDRITEFNIDPAKIEQVENIIKATNTIWWTEMQEEIERDKSEQKEE